jgi:hypothetical protein
MTKEGGTPVKTNGWRVAQVDLRRVARSARKVEQAKAELRGAILSARASGETYRDIGQAAGLTHGRIVQIVREAERSDG